MNEVDEIWDKELFAAIDRGDMTIAQKMLEKKARGRVAATSPVPALHSAVQLGRYDVAEKLLLHGVLVDEIHWGRSALSMTLSHGEAFVRLLLAHGADPNLRTDLTSQYQRSHPPILDICLTYHYDRHDVDVIVNALLEAGADPNFVDEDGWPMLHVAAWHGLDAVVRDLIAHGANVNAVTPNGAPALMIACQRGNIAIADMLLSSGADPNVMSIHGTSALIEATRYRHSEIEMLLLSAGAIALTDENRQQTLESVAVGIDAIDITARDDKERTPLHHAAENGSVDLVRDLIVAGAEIDARDNAGKTPLMFAIREASLETVRLLLDAGADPCALDYANYSALNFVLDAVHSVRNGAASSRQNAMSVARTLLSAGVLRVQSDKLPWNRMLSEAVHFGYADFVALLLEYGLDPNTKVYDEPITLDAVSHGEYQIFQTLLDFGADALWNTDAYRDRYFLMAIYSGNPDLVRYFLAAGVQTHLGSPTDVAEVLSYATANGNVEIVKMLVDAGVNLGLATSFAGDEREFGWIKPAVDQCDIPMLRFLLDAGAPAGDALFEAAYEQNHDLVTWLLEYGVSPSATIALGETALMGAIWTARFRQEYHIVDLFLERGADVNAVSMSGETALAWAVEDSELVHRLLTAGADPNGGHGETALMCAARDDQEESVRLLLDARANVNAVTVDGDTAWRLACGEKREVIKQLLVDHGAHEPELARTNLRAAILWKRTEDALRLISEGADILECDIHGHPPLVIGIERGADLRVIEALIVAGANVNQTFPTERWQGSALMKAILYGGPALVRLMLLHGADPNLVNRGYRPLPNAVQYALGYLSGLGDEARAERQEIVRILLSAGASPNVHDGGEGLTPLQEAARCEDIEMIDLLLKYGADLEMPCDTDNMVGRTALSYAVNYLREETAQHLIECGANVNAQSENHDSPLGYACDEHFHSDTAVVWKDGLIVPEIPDDQRDEAKLRLARLLIKHGADVNNRTWSGQTPLIEACNAKHITQARRSLIRLLIDTGAEIDVRDEWGNTAAGFAKAANADDIVDLLTSRKSV